MTVAFQYASTYYNDALNVYKLSFPTKKLPSYFVEQYMAQVTNVRVVELDDPKTSNNKSATCQAAILDVELVKDKEDRVSEKKEDVEVVQPVAENILENIQFNMDVINIPVSETNDIPVSETNDISVSETNNVIDIEHHMADILNEKLPALPDPIIIENDVVVEPAEKLVQLTKTGADVVNDRDYDTLSYTDLKALCKQRNLKISGKKADLIERLRANDPIEKQ